MFFYLLRNFWMDEPSRALWAIMLESFFWTVLLISGLVIVFTNVDAYVYIIGGILIFFAVFYYIVEILDKKLEDEEEYAGRTGFT